MSFRQLTPIYPTASSSKEKRKADGIRASGKLLSMLAGDGAYVPAALSVPRSELNVPVPYLLGTARATAPNDIWHGGTELVKEPMTAVNVQTGETMTAPNKWNMVARTNIQLLIGSGPGVVLRAIYQGTRKIWEGSLGPARAEIPTGLKRKGTSGEILLSVGKVIFYGGQEDQSVDPTILESIPDTVEYAYPRLPTYAGFSYVLFQAADRSNDYTGITFEVQRFTNPLGLNNDINVSPDGKDINPMTLLVDALTSRWNDCGYTLASFDIGALRIVAGRLAQEENFSSAYFADDALSTEDFIDAIETQADGIFFEDPNTGLMSFALMRDDDAKGNPSALLHITPDMISKVQMKKGTWEGVYSKARVTFSDRADNYSTGSVKSQTTFSQDVGGANTGLLTISMPLVTNNQLAARLSARALALSAVPQIYLDLDLDRNGARAIPGQIILVTWPRYNLNATPFFVVNRGDMPKSANSSQLSLVQVVDVAANVVFPPEEPSWVSEPDPTPKPPKDVKIISAPWSYARAKIDNMSAFNYSLYSDLSETDNLALPLFLSGAQDRYQGGYQTCEDLSLGTDQKAVDPVQPYMFLGTLANPISRYDGFENGQLPEIKVLFDDAYGAFFGSVTLPDDMTVTRAIFNRQSVAFSMFIGNEILTMIGPSETTGDLVTYKNISRALYDTVAGDHAAGEKVWIFNQSGYSINMNEPGAWNIGKDIQTLPGVTRDWDIFGILWDGQEYSDEWLDRQWTPQKRFNLPQRPQDARIGGLRPVAPLLLAGGSNRTITWRNRPRWQFLSAVSEAGNAPLNASAPARYWNLQARSNPHTRFRQFDDSATNEWDWVTGDWNRHIVRIEDADGTRRNLGTLAAPDATSINVTIPNDLASGIGKLWVSAENSCGSSDEFSIDWLPIAINSLTPAPGYGRNYGSDYGV